MPVHVATHPLIAHKMTLLRDAKTTGQDFRKLLQEITFYLGYESTQNLEISEKKITTPTGSSCDGSKISQSIAIIPILRAGLGMADTMSDIIPLAAVHHIGMYRTKHSPLPIQYYNRLPRGQACDVAFIMDPCIATSNTINAVCSIIKRWGAKKIIVIGAIGSKQGVAKLLDAHPDVELYIAAVDDELSEDGMILPGIGDAGDRQFGTPEDSIVDPLPQIPTSPEGSKRKRNEK